MMLSPSTSAGQSLVKAKLEIVSPKVATPEIPLRFNPTEYQVQKTNTFVEIPMPGLESPPLQFIRGATEKLSAEVVVDTSDTLEDVRKKYVDALRGLMNINAELHAPPIVRLVWDQQVFLGVMESLTVGYTLFTPDGVPSRAKLSIVLKEYRPVEIQVKERPKNSPDVDKRYTVRRGDSLASIAADVYGDPAAWREIARANDIRDPRQLTPGQLLATPRLRSRVS